jgi:hypothetical protein
MQSIKRKIIADGKSKNAKMVGICACLLSIIKGYTPDDAIEFIETEKKPKGKHRFNSQKDIIDMITMKMNDDLSYREIAEIYNIDVSTIYRKINRMKKRLDTEDMVAMKEAGFYYREIENFYDNQISKQAIQQRVTRKQRSLKKPGRKKYSKKELIEGFIKFYQENDRFPKAKEIKNYDYLVSYSTYKDRFGGINKLKEKAREEL